MTPCNMRKWMMGKKLPTNSSASNNHVRETILAWEARIKNYQEFGNEGGKGGNRGSDEAETE